MNLPSHNSLALLQAHGTHLKTVAQTTLTCSFAPARTANVSTVAAGKSMPPSTFSEAAQCQMQVGKGSQLKLVINMMMGAIMAANAEGIELAQGLGLPVESLIEVVNMGAMGTPMFKLKVRTVVSPHVQ